MPVFYGDVQRAFNMMDEVDRLIKGPNSIAERFHAITPAMLGIDITTLVSNVEAFTSPAGQIAESVDKMLVDSIAPSVATIAANMSTGQLFDSIPKFNLDQIWSLPVGLLDTLERLRERISQGEDGRTVLREMNEPWLTALFEPQ